MVRDREGQDGQSQRPGDLERQRAGGELGSFRHRGDTAFSRGAACESRPSIRSTTNMSDAIVLGPGATERYPGCGELLGICHDERSKTRRCRSAAARIESFVTK